MERFRVGLSAGFLGADGTPAYPDFDLSPLLEDPRIEVGTLPPEPVASPQAVRGFDALILLTTRFERSSLPGDGRLALIARFGVGYDSVDVEACTDHAVALAIAPDGVRRPVAVAIVALMLALTTRIMDKDRLARRGGEGWAQKSGAMGRGLVGRTLGLLGMGNIGAEVFRLARPFGMAFIAHDPYVGREAAEALDVRLVDLETLFRASDVLTVCCPLAEEKRGLVSAERIALMKPTAYLINTARGPIVEQTALTEALVQGRIAGAGLDVFEVEPLPAADPLTRLDNVILSPHALAFTDQSFAALGAQDIRAVQAVMRGEGPEHVVNRAVLAEPRFRAKLDAYRARFGG